MDECFFCDGHLLRRRLVLRFYSASADWLTKSPSDSITKKRALSLDVSLAYMRVNF